MTSRSTFNLFGLVIHGYDWEEVRRRVAAHDIPERPYWIVTANPEILLYSKHNPWYWELLRQADLRTVDGFGLWLAGKMTGTRLTGVALAEELVKLGHAQQHTVGIIGGKGESADKAVWHLRREFSGLRITSIPMGDVMPQGEEIESIANRDTKKWPDILFVALGHPKQEAWIAKNLAKLHGVRVVVGVGGTVDFWSGQSKRAPEFLQSIGLEWMWRLFHEPKRWKRIVRATVFFPLAVVGDEITKRRLT